MLLVRSGYQKPAADQVVAGTTADIAFGLELMSFFSSGAGAVSEGVMTLVGGGLGALASFIGTPLLGIGTTAEGIVAGYSFGNKIYKEIGLDTAQTVFSGSSTAFTIASDVAAGNLYSFDLGGKRVVVIPHASTFSLAETAVGAVNPTGLGDFVLDSAGVVYAGSGSPSVQGIFKGGGQPISWYDLSVAGYSLGNRTITIGNTIFVFAQSK